MKLLAGMLVLMVLLAPSAGLADRKLREAECAEVKEKIRNIESRMRAGYTLAEGERYNEKLRELRAKRAKLCR
jgi:hypothetical protein